MSNQEKYEEELDVLTEEAPSHEIILYNDDVNTYDHVLDMLIYACDHEENQAHQCALIVHYKGKCSVKSGDYQDLKPRCSKLLQAGLSAEII